MKTIVPLPGEVRQVLGGISADLAEIAQAAVDRASQGLADDLRKRVTAAGLTRRNDRLSRAVQVTVYPQRRKSIGASGWIFSKAVRIHEAHSQPRTIRSARGRWLVLPLSGARARGLDVKDRWGGALPRKWSQLARLIGQPGVVRLPVRGRRDRWIIALRSKGGGLQPLFLLVRQVDLRSTIDWKTPADRAVDGLYRDLAQQLA